MKHFLLVAVCVVALMTTGCSKRTLMIDSSPQGADVILNHQPVGRTPVSVEFTYYGQYGFELSLPVDHPEYANYGKLNEVRTIRSPLHQRFPADLVTDLMVPATVEDNHAVLLQLPPADKEYPTDGVLSRADEMQGMADGTTPLPAGN